MRILILSAEVWQDGMNGGNVLSNMFTESLHEFAQVYCNPGLPKNYICKKYFQITDRMCMKNFLLHRPVGKKLEFSSFNQTDNPPNADICKPIMSSFFHQFSWGIFHLCRALLWEHSSWRNYLLQNFILEFNPDIIFAPCYGSKFMLQLTRFVHKLTGKKIISYISDDSYTLKQFSLDPFYWWNKFRVRREMRKTFPYYSLVYTMTEQQKIQCEKDFGANMKILRKCAPFTLTTQEKKVHTPIRLIYAGGIYLNRWKTLRHIVNALRRINEKGIKMVLDIYTGNVPTSAQRKALHDGVQSFIHQSVSQEELREIYERSDVALHVESFDLKNRLTTRMSFSTKIVDCLACGCAVMAICDAKQGGFVYLKNRDAAICIDNPENIENVLMKLCRQPELIMEYREKALKCCREKHDPAKIRAEINNDFEEIYGSSFAGE